MELAARQTILPQPLDRLRGDVRQARDDQASPFLLAWWLQGRRFGDPPPQVVGGASGSDPVQDVPAGAEARVAEDSNGRSAGGDDAGKVVDVRLPVPVVVCVQDDVAAVRCPPELLRVVAANAPRAAGRGRRQHPELLQRQRVSLAFDPVQFLARTRREPVLAEDDQRLLPAGGEVQARAIRQGPPDTERFLGLARLLRLVLGQVLVADGLEPDRASLVHPWVGLRLPEARRAQVCSRYGAVGQRWSRRPRHRPALRWWRWRPLVVGDAAQAGPVEPVWVSPGRVRVEPAGAFLTGTMGEAAVLGGEAVAAFAPAAG